MQWIVFVGGSMKPGLVEADDRMAAVEAWLLENPGEHDGLVWALSYIPFNKRKLSRHLAPAPKTAGLVGSQQAEEQEQDADE